MRSLDDRLAEYNTPKHIKTYLAFGGLAGGIDYLLHRSWGGALADVGIVYAAFAVGVPYLLSAIDEAKRYFRN